MQAPLIVIQSLGGERKGDRRGKGERKGRQEREGGEEREGGKKVVC